MNNRIDELLNQATRTIENWKTGTTRPSTDYKLFAKLIINECAEQVWEFTNLSGKYADQQIKEHFGIES